MHIALLGGSFDPIHRGHVQVAQTILAHLAIDQIWYVPAADPPLKNKNMFSFSQRVDFIKKVIAGDARCALWEHDYRENEKSYTIFLIADLQARFPTYRFSFVIGADHVSKLRYWYEYEKLMSMVDFIVVDRETGDQDSWKDLEYFHQLRFVKMPLCDISSTAIRELLKKGDSARDYLPTEIADII